MRFAFALLWLAFIAGCAGKVDYIRPSVQPVRDSNVKIVDRPREAVWNSSVPELGKRFFVINNIDKSSGLINVSYSGDPEKFIDCGRISSYVKNARGERTYDFPGAKAQQSYEVMNSGGLFFLDRRMALEGRVNLVFEEMGPSRTKITASTRYVVQRTTMVRDVQQRTQTLNDSISFNSGGSAMFPAASDGRAAECIATGALERDVLSGVQ